MSSSTSRPQTFSNGIVTDELLDVDAAIAKVAAVLVGLGDLRFEGDDALEAGPEVAGRAHRTRTVHKVKRAVVGQPVCRLARAMAHRVTLIPGDGTGPELTEATRRVLEATGVAFDWDVRHAGVDVMEQEGTPLPDADARLREGEQGRAEGPDHDADRHGFPLGQRRAAPRARPVRLPAPVQDVRGCPLALRQASTS